MEGKKTKKYKTNLIVKYIIYNSKGHFVYFKDLEMKGVMSLNKDKKNSKLTSLLNIYIYNSKGDLLIFEPAQKLQKRLISSSFRKIYIFQNGDEINHFFKFEMVC